MRELCVFTTDPPSGYMFSRVSAKFIFFAPLAFSARTGVLRKQNPGFCAARAAIEHLLKRFSRFGRKSRLFFMARARIIFAVPQGTPVISAPRKETRSAFFTPVLASAFFTRSLRVFT